MDVVETIIIIRNIVSFIIFLLGMVVDVSSNISKDRSWYLKVYKVALLYSKAGESFCPHKKFIKG